MAQTVSFAPGTYLSSSADSLSYYTRDDPRITWETTFSLYPQGAEAIKAAVSEKRYATIVIHAGATGSTIQDTGQKVLLDALRDSDYKLTTAGKDKEWLIYTS